MFNLPVTIFTFAVLSVFSSASGHDRYDRHGQTPSCAANNLIVATDSGTYRGVVNGSAPSVREFLGIPFAEPPTGERRFMPPAKLESNSSRIIDATRYPPSCPQYQSKKISFWSEEGTGSLITGPVSEDCLAVSIWAPAQGEALPVIVFLTGGGWQTGGIEINWQLPHHWVERTQSHIVVTVNYRVNIFGFPNAAGLEDQNLGILDQRMALEWVRDNIEPFGGNPDKITLWGQSAGAGSTDMINLAYPDDPIVTGFFAQSGTALIPSASYDYAQTNFTFVARNVGCDYPGNNTAELDCMRGLPWETIRDFVGMYQENGTAPSIRFSWIADEKIVFADVPARYAQGLVSQRPAILSSCANEGAASLPYDPSGATYNQTAADLITQARYLCPAAETSRLRTDAGLATYRYQYAGNFSNISPRWWMGAFHASDLSMMFATHQDFTNPQGRGSTPFEFAVSESMEDYVLAFMQNPNDVVGWPQYESGMAFRFGEGDVVVKNITIAELDAPCM